METKNYEFFENTCLEQLFHELYEFLIYFDKVGKCKNSKETDSKINLRLADCDFNQKYSKKFYYWAHPKTNFIYA